jgi:hypothetical protein
MSNNNSTKTRSAPIVKKEVKNSCGPGTNIPVILNDEPRLGEYLRVLIKSTTGVTRELIFHHPIGVTDLDDDDWVISEVGDIPSLLSRTKDPYAEEIATARAAWLEQKAIEAGLLEKDASDNTVYTGSKKTTRATFFKELKEIHSKKKTDKVKLDKFDLKDALSRSVDPRAAKEAAVRDLFANQAAAVEREFSTTFRTMGGSRGDRPQEAISWAKKCTAASLSDMLIKHGIEGPMLSASAGSIGDTKPLSVPKEVTANTTGRESNQWCFLPSSLDKTAKKRTKDALNNIRSALDAAGHKDLVFTVSERSAGP